MSNEVREGDVDLNTALRRMLQMGGSDLHLTVGAPPMVRVDGGLRQHPLHYDTLAQARLDIVY